MFSSNFAKFKEKRRVLNISKTDMRLAHNKNVTAWLQIFASFHVVFGLIWGCQIEHRATK